MPNWVKNIVTFKCDAKKRQEIADYIQDFDFNRFIPMPERLNIVSGSVADFGRYCYVYSQLNKLDCFDEKDWSMSGRILTFSKLVSKECIDKVQEDIDTGDLYRRYPRVDGGGEPEFGKESEDISYLWKDTGIIKDPKCAGDLVALGRVSYMNLIEYGFYDWYDWSNFNWGTKWLASNVQINDTGDSLVYTFETAWSVPMGILKHIFKKFLHEKDVEIVWEYADEDIGSENCGRYVKQKDSEGYCADEIKDVGYTKFACEIWGVSEEDLEEYSEDDDEYEEDYMDELNESLEDYYDDMDV